MDDDDYLTRTQFCAGLNWSKPTFYRRRARGDTPEEIYIRGQREPIITLKARDAWLARMEERSRSEDEQAARQRRAENCRRAALIGLQSPHHPASRRIAARKAREAAEATKKKAPAPKPTKQAPAKPTKQAPEKSKLARQRA
ncbi:MAG: hypothetical protein Q8M31_19315 [Beijerinckiaceae bacterium]|nr:hypothetical protein [Beijerinckiaceae bacterium]